MRVDEIMSTKVVEIGPDATASAAARRLRRERIRHLVVRDRGRLVGVITATDLRDPEATDHRTVAELMTARPKTARPEMSIAQAAQVMRTARVGSLPVVEDGEVVGIVTATDVLDELGRERAEARRRARPRIRAARARPRKPDSVRRAPLGTLVPAHVRVLGAELEEEDRGYIRRKLGMKLGKFAESIERVSVRVDDVNGPRGGVDQLCRVKVVLAGLPSVVFDAQDASLEAAVDAAIAGAERAVRRSVQRRRTKHVAPRRTPRAGARR